MSTYEKHRENSMTTTKKTTAELIADIQSEATALLGAVCDYDSDIVPPLLGQLRDTLETARRQGVPESIIATILEEVWQSESEVDETWDEILGVVTVNVWLEDADGTRVRGETVTVDRICWEYDDAEDLLDDAVQQIRDDLGICWEVL